MVALALSGKSLPFCLVIHPLPSLSCMSFSLSHSLSISSSLLFSLALLLISFPASPALFLSFPSSSSLSVSLTSYPFPLSSLNFLSLSLSLCCFSFSLRLRPSDGTPSDPLASPALLGAPSSSLPRVRFFFLVWPAHSMALGSSTLSVLLSSPRFLPSLSAMQLPMPNNQPRDTKREKERERKRDSDTAQR